MRLNGIAAMAVSGLVTIFVVGCANDGFRATKGSTDRILKPAGDGQGLGSGDRLVVTAPSELVKLPRVIDAAASAQSSQIQIEIESLSKLNAQQILGAEVEAREELNAAKKIELNTLLSVNGFVGNVKGLISVDVANDGKALLVENFAVDANLILLGGAEALSNYTLQAVSHCANLCSDLFVHVQINESGKYFSAAFYNFKRNDTGQYVLENSSVDEEYRNVADAKIHFFELTTAENEAVLPSAPAPEAATDLPAVELKAPSVVDSVN